MKQEEAMRHEFLTGGHATVATSSMAQQQMAQDMTALNQADPSLMNNYRLIYEKKIPVKMSLIDHETEERLKKSDQKA